MTKKRSIAVFGTGSDVGKSIIGAALCRIYSDRGMDVAPFKAQNMSNNSGITPEGLEMGRAQIVQAEAARIAPHVDMNPVLLKPTGDKASQVVLLGRALENASAIAYHRKKDFYFDQACRSYDRLNARHDLIVMEGAGSCAEVNLMASDIVNFRMADHADAHVILVADIHRGGVFAQIVGTLECLPEKYKTRIKGFIINRFRGDMALFEEGSRWIESRTGKPVFGVLPWYSHFRVDAEDSVELENQQIYQGTLPDRPCVGVIKLPHIANFTDIHPLIQAEHACATLYLHTPVDLSGFRAVILPGSKNTRADLEWLEETGWAKRIKAFHAGGGNILGICGGYQMLGRTVEDPEGLEGPAGTGKGLGLLPADTVLKAPKVTTLSRFSWKGTPGSGYEIHMGQTTREQGSALFHVESRNRIPCNDEDGCSSEDGRVLGTYMHGLFDSPDLLAAWLGHLGLTVDRQALCGNSREKSYDLLASHFTSHVDMKTMDRILELGIV